MIIYYIIVSTLLIEAQYNVSYCYKYIKNIFLLITPEPRINGLRVHNWVLFAHRPIVYHYFEFKLSYLKNQKLFSITNKIIIWPYSFAKKSWYGVLLFFKAFSWETNIWVMLCDFKAIHAKFGTNLNRLTKKKISCAAKKKTIFHIQGES